MSTPGLLHGDRIRAASSTTSWETTNLLLVESCPALQRRAGWQALAESPAEVEAWLKLPPPIDQVDPTDIPAEHRRIFLQLVRELVEVDGQISSQERESFELLSDLLSF